MSDLQTCLAVFAIAACSNAAAAKPMVVNAIEAYVAAGPGDPVEAVRHLKALKTAYGSLKLNGAVAVTIAGSIERRISLLTVGVLIPNGALTDNGELG